ncbi:MAG: cytochrome b N-terminal domain-containing protein [Promethearchaeota archaeon]
MSKTSQKNRFLEKIKNFLDERLGLPIFRYKIPASANTFGYALGAITAISLIIMGITGAILGVFYVPTADAANTSVAQITANPLLRFVRGLHWWTSLLIPLLILLHATRIVVTGSYKRPRELNWVIGFLLFLSVLGSIYSGTILKWDQEGLEALEHAVEIGVKLGMLPNLTISSLLLPQIFLIHVSILPILLIILFGAHALLIRIHGISEPPFSQKTGKNDRQLTFLDHLKYASIYGLGFLAIVSGLAVAFPRKALPPPIEDIEVTVPPWMFLPFYPFENAFGIIALIIFPGIIAILFILVPFFDRDPKRDPRKGRQLWVFIFMLVILVGIVILNVLAAVVPPEEHFR